MSQMFMQTIKIKTKQLDSFMLIYFDHFSQIFFSPWTFSSSGTGDHLMLPGEHGGQGAQEDPHTATLYGRTFQQTHSFLSLIFGCRGGALSATPCSAKLLSTFSRAWRALGWWRAHAEEEERQKHWTGKWRCGEGLHRLDVHQLAVNIIACVG